MCGGTKLRDVTLCCISPLKIVFDSLKIFPRNKRVFFCIFAFAAVPLSSLVFSLSLSTHPLRSQIYHLEAIALLAPTRFEARHVWKESREDALSLVRIKALFSIPCFLLSLVAAVSSVHATALSYNGKVPTLRSASTDLRQNWKRPSITTIFVYAVLLVFAPLPRAFAALATSQELRFTVLTIGSGVEVYLMAVLSVALVVSIVEDRFGWDAIRVGSGLMAGRRFCGWVLSGLLVLVSGFIRSKMEELDGPISSSELLSAMGIVGKMEIICLYGAAVLWSYVVMTVYYCESRRRHGIREPEQDDVNEAALML